MDAANFFIAKWMLSLRWEASPTVRNCMLFLDTYMTYIITRVSKKVNIYLANISVILCLSLTF